MAFVSISWWSGVALAPAVLMSVVAWLAWLGPLRGAAAVWHVFKVCAVVALLATLVSIGSSISVLPTLPWLALHPFGILLAALVQCLGWVIGVFSSRYLQGEAGQVRYVGALAAVLAAVHLLLLANHWVVLIAAWAAVGLALQRLLCFYADRPFALLAAHKKRMADRIADVLLVLAALLATHAAGSGSLSALSPALAQGGKAGWLAGSAMCVALAVVLRTALLPVHGWLIQVMEAPTPVSALLHAGVVNLGGYVLIRLAPWMSEVPAARWLLVVFGLVTTLVAGLVMLTRISIKVRLAWSTVAQMGFMVLECGLGLYTLAALHLLGHSLYKAHAFLSASSVVRDSRLRQMRGSAAVSPGSQLLAPVLTGVIVWTVATQVPGSHWPWWWCAVLALGWAPMLWLPASHASTLSVRRWRALAGLGAVSGLALVAGLAHALPLGVHDRPHDLAGLVAALGMALMYACLVVLQVRPQALAVWRRWSYAGFYLDEFYTRLVLWMWPTRWTPRVAMRPAASR